MGHEPWAAIPGEWAMGVVADRMDKLDLRYPPADASIVGLKIV